MNPVKIAASTYLNSAPLVTALQAGISGYHYEFIGDAAPARCAAMLAEQQVAAALIPAIEYARLDNLQIVPRLAIAAKEQVASVVLITKKPLTALDRVALDTSSRTSAALVRIVLEQGYQVFPQYTAQAPQWPEMLAANDAALLIGDPAMLAATAATAAGYQVIDLVQQWRQLTNYPFVFAFWAVHPNYHHHYQTDSYLKNGCQEDKIFNNNANWDNNFDFVALLTEASRQGLATREQIATDYAAQLGLAPDFLYHYITTLIHYHLDAEDLAGLHEFYRRAAQLQLITQIPTLQYLTAREIGASIV
jgi:chorismate dehydratase